MSGGRYHQVSIDTETIVTRGLLIPVLLAAAVTSGCATPHQADAAQANRDVALQFYEAGLNRKDADAALQYVGPRYVQHNLIRREQERSAEGDTIREALVAGEESGEPQPFNAAEFKQRATSPSGTLAADTGQDQQHRHCQQAGGTGQPS